MRRFHASFAVLTTAVFFMSSPASADSITPLEISVVGEGAVRVRVAEGTTGPCDSSDDKPLVSAIVEPGKPPLVLPTDAACICWEQTYYPFTEAGWSGPRILCRPQVCVHLGKRTTCSIDMAAPFRLVVNSKE